MIKYRFPDINQRLSCATLGFAALGAMAEPALPSLPGTLEDRPGYVPDALAGIGAPRSACFGSVPYQHQGLHNTNWPVCSHSRQYYQCLSHRTTRSEDFGGQKRLFYGRRFAIGRNLQNQNAAGRGNSFPEGDFDLDGSKSCAKEKETGRQMVERAVLASLAAFLAKACVYWAAPSDGARIDMWAVEVILCFVPPQTATQIMAELIFELSASSVSRERVIDEYFGGIEPGGSQIHSGFRAIRDKADSIIQELRRSWGPTADPQWVNGIVPGRPTGDEQKEFDCLFALFHRPGFWGYVRLRSPEDEVSGSDGYLKLVLGGGQGIA